MFDFLTQMTLSTATVTANREDRNGSSWSTTLLPKQAWLLMLLMVLKVPPFHLCLTTTVDAHFPDE